MMLISMLVLISLLAKGGHAKLSGRGANDVKVFARGEAILTCQVAYPYQFCSFDSPTGNTFYMDPQIEYEHGRISFAGYHDDCEKMTCGMKISPVTEADGGTWECKITMVKEGVVKRQKSQVNVTVLELLNDTGMETPHEGEDPVMKEVERTGNNTKGDDVTVSEMKNDEPSITPGTELDYSNSETNSSQSRDPSLHLHSKSNQGTLCDNKSGNCFCTTKGIIGKHCEKCDTQNHYFGDPIKDSCFYDLAIDYQFTFNLSKPEDKHYNTINFKNVPTKPEVDVDFSIVCSVPAKMNITFHNDGKEVVIFTQKSGSQFKYRFTKNEFTFGKNENTTFNVYLYDFNTPLWIIISFSQHPKLDLLQFFITFSTCFLALLIIAAILWKIKQKYDRYRQMASSEAPALTTFDDHQKNMKKNKVVGVLDFNPARNVVGDTISTKGLLSEE